MKKIMLASEAGRDMAQKRYGKIDSQSGYGRSHMKDVSHKYDMARGGAAHSDEAEDRKLFNKLIAEHEKKEG